MDAQTPGTFFGRLTAIDTDRFESTGSPYIFFRWQVGHYAADNSWEPLTTPFAIDTRLFLTDRALPYTLPRLHAMGFTGDFAAPQVDLRYTQKGATLICTESIKDGTTYINWNLKEWEFDGERKSPLPRNQLDILNARFKAVASGTPAPTPPSTPGAPPPGSIPSPPIADTDDDLPF